MNTKLDNGAADINILAPENLRNPYPMFQRPIADAPVFLDQLAFPRLEADLSKLTYRGGSRFRGIESRHVRV